MLTIKRQSEIRSSLKLERAIDLKTTEERNFYLAQYTQYLTGVTR